MKKAIYLLLICISFSVNAQQRTLEIQKLEKEEAEAKAVQDSLREVEIDRIRRSRDYEIKTHTVANNENMRMISRKYLAEPSKIYLFNPDALGSLKNGMILEIPVKVGRSEVNAFVTKRRNFTRDGNSGSSGYSAAAEVSNQTPSNEVGKKKSTEKPSTNAPTYIDTSTAKGTKKYKIKKGDTLNTVATDNGVKVINLLDLNPSILTDGLKVGTEIDIPVF